jgi:hypothetical protein
VVIGVVVQSSPPSFETNASPGVVDDPGCDAVPTERQNVLMQVTEAPTCDEPSVQLAPPSDVMKGTALPYVFVASLPTSPTHIWELTHEIVPNPAGPPATVAGDQLSPPL